MRPTPFHYMLARGFALATFGSGILVGTAVSWGLFQNYRTTGMHFELNSTALECAIAIIASFPLGCILGGMIIWPFVFFIANLICGAPFQNCDWVYILKGPHRNKLVRVYDVWDERNQVRVEIGEEARLTVKDVFSYNEVCREGKRQNKRGKRRILLAGERHGGGGIRLGRTFIPGSGSWGETGKRNRKDPELLTLCHVYLRDGILFVPTVVKAKTGMFFDAAPVATAERWNNQKVIEAITLAISTGNPSLEAPALQPDAFIVPKSANLTSWAEFEETAACWAVAVMESSFQLIPQRRRAYAGWEDDKGNARIFSGPNALDALLNAVTEQVSDASDRR